MYIPNQMKKEIANIFYDKTITILSPTETVDAEGGVTRKGLTNTGTFKGNVNFSNCKQIQEDYGLDYNIDVSITTSTDTAVSMNDIISYDNVVYNVTDVLSSDSHILIVATKWRQ